MMRFPKAICRSALAAVAMLTASGWLRTDAAPFSLTGIAGAETVSDGTSTSLVRLPATLRATSPAASAVVSSADDGETVTLVVEGPDKVQTKKAALARFEDAGDPHSNELWPEVSISEGKLRIHGPAPAITNAMADGTRSLWVALDSDKALRVDVPGPEIDDARMAAGDATRGPSLTLSVNNLLAGFVVVYATQSTNSDGPSGRGRSAQAQIMRSNLSFPKIESSSITNSTGKIVIRFAPLSPDTAAVRVFLSVINLDGSRTQSLEVTQKGNKFLKKAEFVSEVRPLPVDFEVITPDVELVTLADAMKKARDAGFLPIPCDMDSLTELSTAGLEDGLVLRQGLAAGARSRRGETLLLGIRINRTESRETVGGESNVELAVPPPLAPVGPTGFVAVPVASATIDGRLGMTGEGLFQARPSLAADGGSSSLRDSPDGDGGTSNSTEESADTASDGPSEDAPDDVPLPSAVSVIPVDPDPGINLDPATTADQDSLAAVLHVTLNAILPMVGQRAIPGNLGDAISSAVRECEPEMAAAWKTNATQDAGPAEKVLKIVATKLGVAVASTDSQSALDAWRDYAQSRANYALLDENKNGFAADDVAVWFIIWLQKKGLFNPASSVRLVRSDVGSTVAIVSPNRIQPDWVAGLTIVNGLLHLALNGDSGASSTAGGNGNASGETNNNTSANSTTVTIPKGTSPVTITSPPSRIRVPDALNGQLARDVVPKIREVGLQLKADGTLISTDKVTQTEPAQGAWVSPSDRIVLKILRRVPRVTGQKAKDAETKLKDFELSPRTHEDAVIRPEDLVSAQQPSEGDYVERGTAVLLTFHRKVPKVEGLTARVAQTQLTEAGFRALGPVDGDIFANDVVLKQDPAWEQNGNPVFCEPGAAVRFVRLGARVPDLCGANLAAAKTILDARNLLDKCQLRYELGEPITDFALAKVLDQTPAAGAIIDRSQGKVEFHVVVPMPELAKLAPLNDVQNKLRERDLLPELTVENAMPDDVVVSAVASGRVFTADSVRYVAPGSKVQLTVGRVVPSLNGASWKVALGELQRMGFRHQVSSGESPGTHVHHTSPEGGKVIATTEPVLLHPGVRIPDVVGTPLDEAKARVERLGLGVRTTTTLQEVEDPGLQGKTKVARQSPQPDDIVLRSSATIVLLSAVQYGEGGVAVPQFQGLAYTDAKELAEELGLRLVVRTSATRITQNRDQHGRKLIDGQFTAAGTRVRKGTDIGVSVNQLVFQQPRPEYVAVPDLVNDRARETQFTVEQAIAIAKQAKFTPIISYRGQQFNEAGWAVLAASYLIPPNTPPQVRRDLQAFRALSIYQLRAGNQSPAPKTQAQPGDRIVIEVRVAASR